MNNDLKNAKEMLLSESYTCVLCRGEMLFCSCERGVKPLLGWLDSDTETHGFSAADRVVGRAAAFLYVLLGVRFLYADIMSEPAREVLMAHGIEYTARQLVPAIRNRTGDGFCPMESAVRNIENPEAALAAIREKVRELSSGR